MHLALISKDYNHSSNVGVVDGSNFKRDDLGFMTFSPGIATCFASGLFSRPSNTMA